MNHKTLRPINILTIVVLLFLLVYSWIYLNSQFSLAASLAVYALLAVSYINVREMIGAKAINILILPALFLVSAYFWIFQYVSLFVVAGLTVSTLVAILCVSVSEAIRCYIDTGRISNDIRVDVEGERRLKAIKDLVLLFAIGLALFFDAFAWDYMNAQFLWAILVDILIAIFAGFIILTFKARYFILKKTNVSILKVIIAMIALLLVIAYFFISVFTWISMPASISFLTPPLLILVTLLLLSGYTYINVKRTVDLLKKIKNRPAGLINDRTMKIFNYTLLIALVLIIVVIRVYFQGLAELGTNLICLILMLFVTTNIMKVIVDIS